MPDATPEIEVRTVGFDVTALAVAELAERGIRVAGSRYPVSGAARRWLSHSEVAIRYPRWDAIDRANARHAAAWWVRRHGVIKGLTLGRSFPCLGWYRVENEAAQTGPAVVVCDLCGDRFGVRRDEFDKAFVAPPLT